MKNKIIVEKIKMSKEYNEAIKIGKVYMEIAKEVLMELRYGTYNHIIDIYGRCFPIDECWEGMNNRRLYAYIDRDKKQKELEVVINVNGYVSIIGESIDYYQMVHENNIGLPDAEFNLWLDYTDEDIEEIIDIWCGIDRIDNKLIDESQVFENIEEIYGIFEEMVNILKSKRVEYNGLDGYLIKIRNKQAISELLKKELISDKQILFNNEVA